VVASSGAVTDKVPSETHATCKTALATDGSQIVFIGHCLTGRPWIHDFQVNQSHQETNLKTVAQYPQDMQLPSLYRSMMDHS
jgi:hypothetical protein